MTYQDEFTAGQIAKMLGIAASTLVKWDNLGLIPKARRAGLRLTRKWSKAQLDIIIKYMQENYQR